MVDHIQHNISQSSDNFETSVGQMSGGKKISKASDDPIGTSKALALRSMIHDIDQYERNAQSAKSFLEYSDSQLNSATILINEARKVAVAAANDGVQDETSLAAYSSQLDAILEQLTNLADSDIDGKRVFSGTSTDKHPFVGWDANHEYMGDSGSVTSTINSGVNIRINHSGKKIFGPVFSAIESLKKDIQTGDYTSISNNDISAIDQGLTQVSLVRADVGTKLNQINDTMDRAQSSQMRLREQLSSIEDTDVASSYVNMQLAQNVYAASLAATSRAMQYSLINYLH
jgi:flagellar hook-associated protein 3 FlgL